MQTKSQIPTRPRPIAEDIAPIASAATAAATPPPIAGLRRRVEVDDAVLAALSAGVSSRGRETPARAAALRAFAGPVADAAEALAVEATSAATPGAGPGGHNLARAAAALQVRVARLRLRLIECEGRARSHGSGRRD